VSRLAKVGIGVGVVIGALVLVGVLAAATGFVHAYRAPSPSMEPTIHLGDHFLTARMTFPFGGPKRGDIVVFHPPRGADTQECGVPAAPADGHPCPRSTGGESPFNFIKRIVGMPGDELYVSGNRVYIDGKQLHEPYIKKGTPCDQLCNLRKPITVPSGQYYVLGDNRGLSDDSRDWGPITKKAMIGRYLFSYW
jgi:signal peptidase I